MASITPIDKYWISTGIETSPSLEKSNSISMAMFLRMPADFLIVDLVMLTGRFPVSMPGCSKSPWNTKS